MRSHTLLLAWLLVIMPWVAAADDWDALAEVYDRYYYIDGGPLARVDCATRVPFLRTLIENARRALPAESVKLRENLDTFRATFDTKAGPSFVRPTLTVVALDIDAAADPKVFWEGAASLEQDFSRLIDNVEQMLTALYASYIRPRRDDFADVSVSREEERVLVRYRRKGNDVTETIDRHRRHVLSKMGARTVDMTERYEPTGGKSRLVSVRLLMKDPVLEMTTEIAVEYQKLEELDFPASVTAKTQSNASGFTLGGDLDIRLQDCRVE